MGHYLQMVETKNKALTLIALHDAEFVLDPRYPAPSGYYLVCVVENPFFDAAAVVFDDRDFEIYSQPSDPRPKTWLHVPHVHVRQMCPDAFPKKDYS